ncbi:MAG: phosphoribosylaminoimidazolesuccinocarboxamide synthase [Spirochaetota bacterium]
MEALLSAKIPGVKKNFSGKVRDVYKVDKEHLLIVSTDRLSAFDHVFPNGIPGKGIILNTISNLWFSNITFVKNHIVETNFANFPKPFCNFPELLKGRSVIVKKAKRIDFECVVRGYIIGSGWKDYNETGKICGIKLPKGLKMAEELGSPIFTPATKSDSGHDMNVSIEIMQKKLGFDIAGSLAELSLKIYDYGRTKMKKAGILLADTKLEFGILNKEIILIDEAMTPDSSRFWDNSTYKTGESPASFDKQIIRDYLETTDWDKNSPPPSLPDEIVNKTRKKYEEILQKIKSVL